MNRASLLNLGEQMPEFVLPRTQYFFVRLTRINLDRNAIGDFEPEPFDGRALHRMISYQSHSSHTQFMKNLRADPVVARIHLVKPYHGRVGFNGIFVMLVHKPICLKLIHQPDAPAFLLQIQQDTPTFVRNNLEGTMKLPTRVVPKRAEHITKDTLRMHPYGHTHVRINFAHY